MSDWTLESNIPQLTQQMLRGAEDGVRKAGEDVLERSKALVPTETGALRASATATAAGMSADMSYTARYAVPVHERTEARHDDGQAKFLEQAMLSQQDRTLQVIAQAILAAIT